MCRGDLGSNVDMHKKQVSNVCKKGMKIGGKYIYVGRGEGHLCL